MNNLFLKYRKRPNFKKKNNHCQAFPERNGRYPKLVPTSHGGKAIFHKTDSSKMRLEIHPWSSSHLSKFSNRFFFIISESISFFIAKSPCNLLSFSIYLASDIKRHISFKFTLCSNLFICLQELLFLFTIEHFHPPPKKKTHYFLNIFLESGTKDIPTWP